MRPWVQSQVNNKGEKKKSRHRKLRTVQHDTDGKGVKMWANWDLILVANVGLQALALRVHFHGVCASLRSGSQECIFIQADEARWQSDNSC